MDRSERNVAADRGHASTRKRENKWRSSPLSYNQGTSRQQISAVTSVQHDHLMALECNVLSMAGAPKHAA